MLMLLLHCGGDTSLILWCMAKTTRLQKQGPHDCQQHWPVLAQQAAAGGPSHDILRLQLA